jgi:hypothetical protein
VTSVSSKTVQFELIGCLMATLWAGPDQGAVSHRRERDSLAMVKW